jgi:hypothetical protein
MMSSDLDYLRGLDHEQLAAFLDDLRPDPDGWLPGEQQRIEALLDQTDPEAPVEVIPPLRRAA